MFPSGGVLVEDDLELMCVCVRLCVRDYHVILHIYFSVPTFV